MIDPPGWVKLDWRMEFKWSRFRRTGVLFDGVELHGFGFNIQSDSSDDESDHEESNEIMELVGHMLTRDIHDTTVTPHILALGEARQAQVATLSIVERCVIFTQLVRVVQAVMSAHRASESWQTKC